MNLIDYNKKSTIFVMILAFYSFFSYIVNGYLMLVLILGLLLFNFILEKKTKIIFYKENILLFLFCLSNVIGLFYTTNLNNGIKYSISIFVITVIKILLENSQISNRTIKFFLIFSCIHVFATIVYILFPSLIIPINRKILNVDQLAFNLEAFRRGESAGITGQTGTSAFYITIFNAIIFGKWVVYRDKKILYLSLMLLGIIALFFTVKRGPLLFNIIAITFTFIVIGLLDKKKFIKSAITIITFIFTLLLISLSLSTTNPMITKWIDMDDISNGRFLLFSLTWGYFENKPILGNGTLSSIVFLNGGAPHNIYLQVMADLGVIGLVIVLYMLFSNLVKTKKYIEMGILNNNKPYVSMLISSFYVQLYFILYGFTGNALFDINFLLIYIIFVCFTNEKMIKEKLDI